MLMTLVSELILQILSTVETLEILLISLDRAPMNSELCLHLTVESIWFKTCYDITQEIVLTFMQTQVSKGYVIFKDVILPVYVLLIDIKKYCSYKHYTFDLHLRK